MASSPYGKLPIIGVWAVWGSCFYFFLGYQMIGERGKRNRLWIGELLGVLPSGSAKEHVERDEENEAILNETLYPPAKQGKET